MQFMERDKRILEFITWILYWITMTMENMALRLTTQTNPRVILGSLHVFLIDKWMKGMYQLLKFRGHVHCFLWDYVLLPIELS